MRRIAAAGIVWCVLLALPCPSRADDYERWFEVGASFPLDARADVSIASETKFRAGAARSYLDNIGALVLYRPAAWLEFGPSYLYERNESPSGITTFENRYSLEAAMKATLEPARLALRQRVSYRDVSGEASWRYRIRGQIAAAPWGAWKAAPFASEEMFYESASGEFNQSRLMAGAAVEPVKGFVARLYWMALHRRGADGGWRPVNVAGVGAGARF
ncbi:MAG: DUF2490 domain-containing protein [Nitrospinae bacterium]|nr:DUF2490 domain-containing protein [Nitrospinota bacterium]